MCPTSRNQGLPSPLWTKLWQVSPSSGPTEYDIYWGSVCLRGVWLWGPQPRKPASMVSTSPHCSPRRWGQRDKLWKVCPGAWLPQPHAFKVGIQVWFAFPCLSGSNSSRLIFHSPVRLPRAGGPAEPSLSHSTDNPSHSPNHTPAFNRPPPCSYHLSLPWILREFSEGEQTCVS